MLVRAVRKLAIHGGKPVREKPYPAWSGLGERENELLREVLASEQWGGFHEFVSKFEQLFAQLHDCEHGVAAANGTLALEMALEAAGIREGGRGHCTGAQFYFDGICGLTNESGSRIRGHRQHHL